MTFNQACKVIVCKNCHSGPMDHGEFGECLFVPGSSYTTEHPKATWESVSQLIRDGMGSSASALLLLLTGRPYGLQKSPKYGDLLTFKQFADCARNGALTSYDGHGYYATDRRMSDMKVSFVDLAHPPYPELTHVIWFNK